MSFFENNNCYSGYDEKLLWDCDGNDVMSFIVVIVFFININHVISLKNICDNIIDDNKNDNDECEDDNTAIANTATGTIEQQQYK